MLDINWAMLSIMVIDLQSYSFFLKIHVHFCFVDVEMYNHCMHQHDMFSVSVRENMQHSAHIVILHALVLMYWNNIETIRDAINYGNIREMKSQVCPCILHCWLYAGKQAKGN